MDENRKDEIVSMVLGLVIVVAVIGIIYSFFQKKRGSVSLPGVTITESNITPSPTEVNNEYEVKAGDNLWKIAQSKYNDGFQWTIIAKENNLKNPRILRTGQKLKLPEIKSQEIVIATIDKNQDYKVIKGDSLWKIAVKAYGDGYKWVSIYQENKSIIGKNPGLLITGMVLKFPKT